jgi:4-hydroxy-tetrahydrodipicolinate synthase
VILDAVVRGGIPHTQLIVGTGCCALGDCVTLTRHALATGVARVLVLPPFYYKHVRDEGVIEAYGRTIEAVGDASLRLYFYNIPQMSGVEIGAGVVEPLMARYPEVIAGIKDSAGDWGATESLCRRFGNSLDVLVGSERFLTQGIAAGASGCVTATANAFAAPICELYERIGDPDAPALQENVSRMRAVVERYPAIAALKELEARRSGETRWRNVRPPLTELSRADGDALASELGAATSSWKVRP